MARCPDCGATVPTIFQHVDRDCTRTLPEKVAAGQMLAADDPDEGCNNPGGHEWAYTGTAYGGDDESYHGEGRCYCVHCGADGDA